VVLTLEKLLPYIHRFVERVVARCRPRMIAIYGSLVRGEATAASDIDICVLLEEERDKDAVYFAASETNEEITSEGLKNLITPTILLREEDVPTEFLEEGITLWGRAIHVAVGEMGVKPMTLIAYDTSGLDQSQKAMVRYALHGRMAKKTYKGKTYISRSEGLLKSLGAKQMGNALLVEAGKETAIKDLFQRHGVRYERIDVYG